MNQLIANLILNTGIFFLGYRWLLKPRLLQLNASMVLTCILLLHSMRHLGLMFLATGVVQPGMPQQFAVPSAAGDFLAATLAIIAATLIRRKSSLAIPMTWMFTVVGSLDFLMAIALSRIFKAGDFMGAAYWIPAFWVPMLIVGHLIIFDVLRMIQRKQLSLGN
jgi:hypothetical protein